MILTDYYRGENLPGNSKTRYDITASTGTYEPFERKLKNRKGGHCFYFGDVPHSFHFASNDRPDKAITKGDNISSVFVPDVNVPFAFGDVAWTSDALLIIFSEDYKIIELFIARGQRNNRRNLYILLVDGELDREIEILRK
jgi:hypothetical protein